MTANLKSTGVLEEVAEFLATSPSPDQLLTFRPSESVQQKARELLDKQGDGRISADELRELDQFEHAERLMRLIKAKLRAGKPQQP